MSTQSRSGFRVITGEGQTVDVPLEVEAQGGDAIEKYVAEQLRESVAPAAAELGESEEAPVQEVPQAPARRKSGGNEK